MEIKDRIKALRKQVPGLTQEKLAEKAGLARTDVTRVESGRNQITSRRMLEALAKGFDMPKESLAAYLEGAMPLHDALASIGEVRAEAPASATNLDKALAYWGEWLSPAVVKPYRAEWAGRENDRAPAEHGAELVDRQQALNAKATSQTRPNSPPGRKAAG